MSNRIIWSPEAQKSYSEILDYLNEQWGQTAVSRFIDRTESIIGFIRKYPKQYIFSETKNAYRAVVVKQVSLFYRVQPDQIELLTFWDNRKNPDNLESSISEE